MSLSRKLPLRSVTPEELVVVGERQSRPRLCCGVGERSAACSPAKCDCNATSPENFDGHRGQACPLS